MTIKNKNSIYPTVLYYSTVSVQLPYVKSKSWSDETVGILLYCQTIQRPNKKVDDNYIIIKMLIILYA